MDLNFINQLVGIAKQIADLVMGILKGTGAIAG